MIRRGLATLPAVTAAEAPAARLLALDTATETLHLALQTPAGVLTRRGEGGAQASATLLPQMAALLREAGMSPAQLEAVACGIGPGAFTGLRTACSVVQGLALGLHRPVLAVPTLMAIAECAHRQGASGPVWALQDARMGEVYAALYERGNEGWSVLVPPMLLQPEPLLAALRSHPAALAGNALHIHPALADAGQAIFSQAVPDGVALMALAQQAWRRGEAMDPAGLLPLYVRDKVAQTTAERAGQRG